MKINVARVRELADRLQANVADRVVDMVSVDEPACGTPGCHAGEIWLAYPDKRPDGRYSFAVVAEWLSEYLMGEKHIGEADMNNIAIVKWAKENPDIWGSPWGKGMFSNSIAFGNPKNLTAKHIADWWSAVADRLEALEGKPKRRDPVLQKIMDNLEQKSRWRQHND